MVFLPASASSLAFAAASTHCSSSPDGLLKFLLITADVKDLVGKSLWIILAYPPVKGQQLKLETQVLTVFNHLSNAPLTAYCSCMRV